MLPRGEPGMMVAGAARCRADRTELGGGGTTRGPDHERTRNEMTRKTMALLTVLAAALLLTAGTALADRIRCPGGLCRGTQQADVMSGTAGADQIFGLGGDDQLTGKTGKDRLSGGVGNDLIFGESEDDRLNGGPDADRIVGGDGVDTIFGGTGSDVIDSASDENLGPLSDFVDCDTGFDTVTADFTDRVAANCEQVTRV